MYQNLEYQRAWRPRQRIHESRPRFGLSPSKNIGPGWTLPSPSARGLGAYEDVSSAAEGGEQTVTTGAGQFSPNTGTTLENIFAGFGSLLGQTASRVATIKAQDFVNRQQLQMAPKPVPFFGFTNPATGATNVPLVIGAGLVALGVIAYMMKKR